jgi:hypothetical protein
VGHPPVAVRWASAQRKIRSSSSAGRSRAAELCAPALPARAGAAEPVFLLMV